MSCHPEQIKVLVMGEILYDLVIQPIWLLLEVVFKIAYTLCGNPGISIIFVSLTVNILILPLYLKSDALCEQDRAKQKLMEPWIKHIRKTFKGDERFMILSEYYRQNDYQPYYVLRSSLSLLLQIPFFVAAYSFLSNLQLLHGVPFMMIKDLGRPDGILSVAGLSVNVLPILMTAINLISSFIYTKNGPMREKVQTIALALVFLVLLYTSPAGLVFYWTLNNLFSLCKNIVMTTFVSPKHKSSGYDEPEQVAAAGDTYSGKLWFSSALFISVLVGAIIPLSVIVASPLEFIERGRFADPTMYVYTSIATAAGLFLVWGGVVFYLGTALFKRVYSIVCVICAVTFFMNYMFFDEVFGVLFEDLRFSELFMYSSYEMFLNVLVTIYVALILVIVVRKYPKAVITAAAILSVSAAVIAVYQTVQTSVRVRESDNYALSTYVPDDFEPVLKLSRTGKNVVILVMDKAIGRYIPYILQEKPELAQDFSGFVYYPNTVSTASCTSQGIPSLYGGYEYTAWEINQRADETLADKVNESLKVLPELFSDNGFHSTICDIPYGNFDDDGDLSIYDDVKNCDTYSLTSGMYSGFLTEDEEAATDPRRQVRNFFCYSLCRVAPLAIQRQMYDEGDYLALTPNRVTNAFVNSYVVMKHLTELTDITDDSDGELIMMQNYMAHEPNFLDPPDYLLTSVTEYNSTEGRDMTVDGVTMKLDNDSRLKNYDTDISAYLLMAKWFQALKDEGVYDNTRIVITSDHGYPYGQFDDMIMDDIDLDVEAIDPVLMVKDFDASGSLVADETFMVNADVPTIVLEGIVNDPVNPYSGNVINSDAKRDGLIVNASTNGLSTLHGDYVYDISDSHWYTVKEGNICDRANWELYGQ